MRAAATRNSRKTIREVSEDVHLSGGLVESSIIVNMSTRHVSAKLVSSLLSGDQKDTRDSVVQDFLAYVENKRKVLKLSVWSLRRFAMHLLKSDAKSVLNIVCHGQPVDLP